MPDGSALTVGTGATTLGGALDVDGGAIVSLESTATAEDVLAITAIDGKTCERGTGLVYESPGDVVRLTVVPEDLYASTREKRRCRLGGTPTLIAPFPPSLCPLPATSTQFVGSLIAATAPANADPALFAHFEARNAAGAALFRVQGDGEVRSRLTHVCAEAASAS